MRKGKQIIAGLLAAMMVSSSLFISVTEVKAAVAGSAIEVKTVIEYVDTDYATFQDCFGKQEKVPTMEGYLFGGWYEEKDGTTAIKTADQVPEDTVVYAKFVPAYLLSVKAQNHSSTKRTDETDYTNVRLVSGLDCKNYKNAGFEIIDIEANRTINADPIKTVYSKLAVYKDGTEKTYTPQQIFGTVTNAVAQKFIVLTLNSIPESKWNSDIYVRPYWTTFDGVKVYGLGKYVYVNDGLDGWISVPINLHTGANVAAGLLDVGFNSQFLEYQGYRRGRVFEEMDANVMMDGATVKCAGNVSELVNASANDIYITLRFKLKNNYEIGNGEQFLKFTASNMNFVNLEEENVTMNILDIQY